MLIQAASSLLYIPNMAMGQCGSSAAAGSAVIPVWSVLALPGGDQALYSLWSC